MPTAIAQHKSGKNNGYEGVPSRVHECLLLSITNVILDLPFSASHTFLLVIFSPSYSLFAHPPISRTIGKVELERMGFIRQHPHRPFALESGRPSSSRPAFTPHIPTTIVLYCIVSTRIIHEIVPKTLLTVLMLSTFSRCSNLHKLESSKSASYPLDISPSFRSRFLRLEDLSDAFIADISKSAYFNGLRITSYCQLPSLQHFDNVPNTLILEDSNSNVNLLNAVTAWKGGNLWLDSCHSSLFPGLFLEAVRRRSHVGYPCNEMRRLHLYRLSTFSIVLLQILIKKRNKYVR